MNRLHKILLLAACVSLSLVSCKEDELTDFSGENNVYFTLKRWPSPLNGYTVNLNYDGVAYRYASGTQVTSARDSIIVAFADIATEKTVCLIPVSMMGGVSDADRPIGYRILKTTTAVEGEDFRVLAAFIPAKAARGGILVELSRENVSDTKSLVVDFELIPNENFSTNFTKVYRSANEPDVAVDTRTFRVWFDDGNLPLPMRWIAAFQPYYGAFSERKLSVLITLGLTKEGIYATAPDTGVIPAFGSLLKRYLQEMEDAGTPILEKDGSKMTAGTSAT